MFHAYVLYSQTTDTYYKGSTADLTNRIRRHNAGMEKATKRGCPWKLIASFSKTSRSEAMILEKKLKNLSRERLLNFIKKYYCVAVTDELQ